MLSPIVVLLTSPPAFNLLILFEIKVDSGFVLGCERRLLKFIIIKTKVIDYYY